MAIKKSDLYSKLWSSCDELRGGMVASQYKDYVLVLLLVRPLEGANRLRIKANFNDDALLGQGKEKVDKLTNLIGIFESNDLDFSRHRADGDDLLGDAYEYLMRHSATESGKRKGQFYTPAEVNRVMAQAPGIAKASPDSTVYDPTCGSGSLLLRVAGRIRLVEGAVT